MVILKQKMKRKRYDKIGRSQGLDWIQLWYGNLPSDNFQRMNNQKDCEANLITFPIVYYLFAYSNFKNSKSNDVQSYDRK